MTSFKISGEFITLHTRRRMYESGPDEGLRFLTDSLPGLPHTECIAILVGTKKLDGMDGQGEVGLFLVEDDDKEAKNWLKQRYGGIVKYGEDWWTPYAFVNGWGPLDAEHEYEHPIYLYSGPIPSTRQREAYLRWFIHRNVPYLDNPKEDLIHQLLVDDELTVTLWKKQTPPPYWYKEVGKTADWQEALSDFLLSGNVLEERNHTNYLLQNHQVITMKQIAANDISLQGVMENMGLTGSQAKGLSSVLEGKEFKKPEPTTDYEDMEYGYILPDGKAYTCLYHQHSELAASLLDDDVPNPCRVADDLGWIRITVSTFTKRRVVAACRPLTKVQEQTFISWALANKFAPSSLEKRWEY